jgi:hypothetical protein
VILCTVPGCKNKHNSHGFCQTHLQRLRLHGDVNHTRRPRERKPCSVDGCNVEACARGWCQKHYVRWKVHGDPMVTRLPRRHDISKEPSFCSVFDCHRQARTLRSGLCDLHYHRRKRSGSTDAPSRRPLSKQKYVVRKFSGHPMAFANGRAFVHRVVLYDQTGPGRLPCFWCGRAVRWDRTYPIDNDALIVDHVDHDRHNNDSRNLVPACNSCNSVRRLGGKELVSVYQPGSAA